MQIKVNIGSAELTFEGKDYEEAIKHAAAFTQIGKCGSCKGEHIALDFRKATPKEGKNAGKTFEYMGVVCLDCYAKANIHKFDPIGYYFVNKWEKYEANK